jgi:2-polyprenyl-3-methyl-5-hydroxy-6-metoxy-1,4-benzoquinol methylase
MISTKNRSDQREIMDDFTLEGKHLRENLDILATINKWLGGNQITLNGIKKLVDGLSKDKKIRIVDLGCGNGDLLRRISKLGAQLGYNFDLVGIDANKDSINYAKKLSEGYENITYLQLNIFSEEFKAYEYDIALLTLFLHHLNNEEIIENLNHLKLKAKLGIVVNDLHRNKIAYFLFSIISVFFNNKIVRNDGLVSILRAFKRSELEYFAKELNIKSEIGWRWAFRYQWIMYTKI